VCALANDTILKATKNDYQFSSSRTAWSEHFYIENSGFNFALPNDASAVVPFVMRSWPLIGLLEQEIIQVKGVQFFSAAI